MAPGGRPADRSLGAGQGPGQGQFEVTLTWSDQSHCVEGAQEGQGTCLEAGGEGGGVRTPALFCQPERACRSAAAGHVVTSTVASVTCSYHKSQ